MPSDCVTWERDVNWLVLRHQNLGIAIFFAYFELKMVCIYILQPPKNEQWKNRFKKLEHHPPIFPKFSEFP